MTKEQKQRIRELKSAGLGYVRISRDLGIPENTVKSFLRRNTTPVRVEKFVCKCCGRSVEQNPGRKEKKFCSDRCRMKWWNSHPELIQRKAVHEFNCPTCGRRFSVYGKRLRKYCCHQCYIEDRFGGGGYE